MAEENFQLAKPLGDRVLIQLKVEEKTASGIILTDSAQTLDGKIGDVIAVGNGVYTNNGEKIPMEIKVGDRVMMPQGGMSSQKVTLGDKEYYLCREIDIPMVIR